MSSIRSASSSTNTSSRSRRMWRWPIRSSRRPGVATRMSTPRARAWTCGVCPTPPKTTARGQPQMATVGREARLDLGRELAGRGQDQDPAGPRPGPARLGRPGAAGSAARTRRSCRCRSGRNPGGRGPGADGGSPGPGSASAWRSSRRGRRAEWARSARARQRMSPGSRFRNGRAPAYDRGAGRFRPSRARPRQPLCSKSRDAAAGTDRLRPALRAREEFGAMLRPGHRCGLAAVQSSPGAPAPMARLPPMRAPLVPGAGPACSGNRPPATPYHT